MVSGAIILVYIPTFMKVGSGTQKLIGMGGYKDTWTARSSHKVKVKLSL
jgi:hypothetical protein